MQSFYNPWWVWGEKCHKGGPGGGGEGQKNAIKVSRTI